MAGVARGRLSEATSAPASGERVDVVIRVGGLAIEQISTGALSGPVDYRQDQDEWVMVLEGGAVLEVDGEAMDLAPRSWVHLPAGIPHRLVSVVVPTTWLTVLLPPP